MLSKKKLLKGSDLYLILDTEVNSRQEIPAVAESALRAGIRIFQLRDKYGSGRDCFELARRLKQALRGEAVFIVNDRCDIAMAAEADGVHLGQDDLPVSEARRICPPDFLIGVSCQNLSHSERAQSDGADYIGFGSVFKTQTKPDRDPMDLRFLHQIACSATIPAFAIGGINSDNVASVYRTGIQRVAVCRDLCLAEDMATLVEIYRERMKTAGAAQREGMLQDSSHVL